MAPAPDHETQYKLLKEAFVSNHTGGTISEINLVTAIAPVSYLLYCVLQSRLRLFTPYGPIQFLLDFVINCGAILLSCTLYSSQPVLLIALILGPAVLIQLSTRPVTPKKQPVKPKGAKKDGAPNPLPKKPFITVYRSSMMAITCIAILAVDFKVFPRRFAKVENWGTSLMDMGVGSFVFSSGIVSVRSVVKGALTGTKTEPFARRMKNSIRHSIPLLALGMIRLVMVKGVDYAEHVTEYGVHWNFFFTLGLLPPFLALLQSLVVSKNVTIMYTVLSLLVAVVYQMILHSTGLEEFVLVGDRHKYGLISMNKEGIASFAGYLAIFLAGMATGSYILVRDQKNAVLKKLVGWSVFWTAAFYAVTSAHGAGVGVSRRIANLPYVLWVANFNTMQLAAFYLVERYFSSDGKAEEERYEDSVPVVLEALNRNGLIVFLVANLLTGLVNVSVKTLEVGDVPAMGILTGYMLVVAGVAMLLHLKKITIKL